MEAIQSKAQIGERRFAGERYSGAGWRRKCVDWGVSWAHLRVGRVPACERDLQGGLGRVIEPTMTRRDQLDKT